MYHLIDYIYLAEYIAPAVSAFSCLVLLLLSYGDSYTHTEKRIKTTVILYMCASLFTWMGISAYVFFPEMFTCIQSLGYLSLLLVQVLFYRLFFILTALNDKERFSPWHYAVPLAIFVTAAVWSLWVPYEVRLDLVIGRQKVISEGYEMYSRFILSKLPVRCLFSVIYITLTFRRLAKYYKRTGVSSSLVRRPARWLILLVALAITLAVTSSVGLFIRQTGLFLSPVSLIAPVVKITQQIVLTFIIIQRRYILYITFSDESPPGVPPDGAAGAGEKKNRKSYSRTSGSLLTRGGFDAWFKKHKPYLDPAFRITDMVGMTGVNRSYISAFVNRTYGMNFNRYVNRLRLRELDRITALATNKNKPLRELVPKAGFTDAEHHRRALAAEKGKNGQI